MALITTTLVTVASVGTGAEPASGVRTAGDTALDESVRPVRPGIPEHLPFWNAPSHQFIYAPEFDFKPVAGAKSYRFALNFAGKIVSFEASDPWASLSPIWASVPIGPVTLTVEGLDQPGGAVLGKAGERRFHRAAFYNGPYRPVKTAAEYRRSALLALQTMFSRQYFKDWMRPGVPPIDFRKGAAQGTQLQAYAYPAKLIGQIIAGSVLYARSNPPPADAEEILKIGEKAGELLTSLHFRAGKAMEDFPPTYAPEAQDAPVTHVLMFMPAEVAEAYLDFHEATRDPRYLEAALGIAGRYRNLQLPSGTWYQVAESEHGGACYNNLLVPTTVIQFFDRLVEHYGKTEFREVNQAALRWVRENALKTYNWQSQFEDGKPNRPYGSLSPQQACEFAQYLFRHVKDDPRNLSTAIELLRFAEDQFVVWEQPPLRPQTGLLAPLSSDKWITPCVCEQHQYWFPVNYSFGTLIHTYLAAFRATGERRHLAKAADLASTLLEVQTLHKGEYSTYPVKPTEDGKFEQVQNVWFNCTVGAARAVLELSQTMEGKREQCNPWKPRQEESGKANFFLRPAERVMFLGNSITAMAKPEIDFIKARLEQQNPELATGDSAVQLVIEGTPGWQAWQGLEKLDEYLLTKHKPTVCVIAYGTCEVTFQNQKSYVPAMKAIIKKLREAGVAMTIVAAPPPSPKNWKQSFPVETFVKGLPEMGRLARQVAEEEKIPFIDTPAAFDSMIKVGQEFTTDGIHLNEAGYNLMADALIDCWRKAKR